MYHKKLLSETVPQMRSPSDTTRRRESPAGKGERESWQAKTRRYMHAPPGTRMRQTRQQVPINHLRSPLPLRCANRMR